MVVRLHSFWRFPGQGAGERVSVSLQLLKDICVPWLVAPSSSFNPSSIVSSRLFLSLGSFFLLLEPCGYIGPIQVIQVRLPYPGPSLNHVFKIPFAMLGNTYRGPWSRTQTSYREHCSCHLSIQLFVVFPYHLFLYFCNIGSNVPPLSFLI